MIKKLICITIIMLVVKTKAQQNLVPNPSFEIFDTCPYLSGQIKFAKNWFSPSGGSPDYFNSCASPTAVVSLPNNVFGNVSPQTGQGIVGLYSMDITNDNLYREYVGVKLNTQLLNNQRYYTSFFVRLPDSIRYATSRFFVFFGDSLHRATDDTINVISQITTYNSAFYTNKTSWQKVKGSFVAQGSEKFLYIGYFKHPFTNDTLFVGGGAYNSFNFSYYYIDDVCVTTDSLYNENWAGVGLNENNELEPVRVYPLVITDKLYFQNPQFIESILIYNIQSVTQYLVLQNNSIDFANMPSGIYIINLTTKRKQNQKIKVIKINP